MSPTTLRALRALEAGPLDCSTFGAKLWGAERRGRVSAVQGGGDYAAQCYLGKLRKRGLVEVEWGEGSSSWVLTKAGRAALEAL